MVTKQVVLSVCVVAVAFGAERAAFLDFFPMGAEPTGR